jgi:oxygen-independent coproporphyrinogen III oxidase
LSGIYIHIPFCKKACFYCDFHFSVSFKIKEKIITAICQELIIRKDFFDPKETISSIYFGGGTPSVLSIKEIDEILGAVYSHYNVEKNAEITFECNPDDLTQDYLRELKFVGINRLSIGVQSFNDEYLKWMNRSHDASQSKKSIEYGAEAGFNNITLDLIYGLPQLSNKEWSANLNEALSLPINHLSAYSLTMEENTPYIKLVNQGKYKKPSDDISSSHYQILVQQTTDLGWEHYEVSSFCKPGNYSKHNSSYWSGNKYIGVGPSAHSYDGNSRYWNVSDNKSYLECISTKKRYFESEELTVSNRVNEYLLTGLRTKWGVDLELLSDKYDYNVMSLFEKDIKYWISLNWMEMKDSNMKLTNKGMLFADHISSTLFLS